MFLVTVLPLVLGTVWYLNIIAIVGEGSAAPRNGRRRPHVVAHCMFALVKSRELRVLLVLVRSVLKSDSVLFDGTIQLQEAQEIDE